MQSFRNTILFLLVSVLHLKAQVVDWVQHIRPGGNEYVWDVVTDNDAFVYATGRVKFNSTFGWSPNISSPVAIGSETDVFLVKYDPSGNLVWAVREGGTEPDWGRSVAVANDKSIVVVGDYAGTAMFGSTQLTAVGSITNRNLFITKYDSMGVAQWALSAGNSSDHSRAYGVDIDDLGYIYVSGHISGTSTLNGVSFGISGINQPFFAKLDSSGNVKWIKTLGATYGGEINEIITENGFVYVIGSFRGNMNTGGTFHAGNSPSWRDVFCAKLDTAGNWIWSKSAVGGFNDQGYGLDLDEEGNVYITGTFANDITFSGAGTFNSLGTAGSAATANAQIDGFIAKYSSAGIIQWVKQIGAAHNMPLSRLAVDRRCGKIYVTGSFRPPTYAVGTDTLDFIDSTYNVLLYALNPDGSQAWYKTYGGPGYNHCDGIAVDQDGSIIQGGHFDQDGFFDSFTIAAQNGMDGFVLKITPPLDPEITLSQNVICENSQAAIHFCQPGIIDSISLLIDGLPFSYSLSDDSLFFQLTDTGLHSVEIYAANSNGSGVFSSDSINVISTPVFSLGIDTGICNGETLWLKPDTLFSNTFWNDGLQHDSVFTDTSGIYWLEASPGGCSYRDSVFVTVYQLPAVSLGNDTAFCEDAGFSFQVSGFSDYLWSDGSSLPSLNVYTSGNYYVRVTDTNSCSSNSDTVSVVVISGPDFTLGADTNLCMGQSIALDPGGYISYLWQDGSTSQIVVPGSTGMYHVTVTDSNSCSDSDTIFVLFYDLPVFSLGPDTIICANHSFSLDPGSFNSYLWSDSSSAQVFIPAASGIYYVQVTDNNSCSASDSVNVTIDSCLSVDELFSENFFSVFPNPADEDLFIEFDEPVSGNIIIYSLSGSLIFETSVSLMQQIHIPLNDFSMGMYVVYFQNSEGKYFVRSILKD